MQGGQRGVHLEVDPYAAVYDRIGYLEQDVPWMADQMRYDRAYGLPWVP
jgi:hypothetical protein